MASSTLPAFQVEQLDFSEAVTVNVGEGDAKQQFLLHKNIISRHSKFFRAAFSGNFAESKDKSIELPEADPAIFKIWIQWAYSGNMALLSASEQEVGHENYALLARRCGELYVLADTLEDTLCRNTATDLLRNRFLGFVGPSVHLYQIAYESTPEGSKLRKVCLDWMLASSPGTWLAQHRNELPTALFVDLAIEWEQVDFDSSHFVRISDAPKCEYHDHDKELPACKEEPKETSVDKKKA
ncbi:Kelch repeat and BTB domain-containing protein 2 [Pseudocercospora fuligena]|uniref:Kelch repeat and BTB domain-containing protein 2 n=1 Tax=Pseudocercospora fuligena TaxID=685502 RepID=A0A8H6RMG2_9PEZI|nr:Kelch repeat and BTB domain-containing protein 2 [Pseudocercospora fuligena]